MLQETSKSKLPPVSRTSQLRWEEHINQNRLPFMTFHQQLLLNFRKGMIGWKRLLTLKNLSKTALVIIRMCLCITRIQTTIFTLRKCSFKLLVLVSLFQLFFVWKEFKMWQNKHQQIWVCFLARRELLMRTFQLNREDHWLFVVNLIVSCSLYSNKMGDLTLKLCGTVAVRLFMRPIRHGVNWMMAQEVWY
jgi:hypothetical protein